MNLTEMLEDRDALEYALGCVSKMVEGYMWEYQAEQWLIGDGFTEVQFMGTRYPVYDYTAVKEDTVYYIQCKLSGAVVFETMSKKQRRGTAIHCITEGHLDTFRVLGKHTGLECLSDKVVKKLIKDVDGMHASIKDKSLRTASKEESSGFLTKPGIYYRADGALVKVEIIPPKEG